MNEREKLILQRERLANRFAAEMQGRVAFTPKAIRLRDQMKEIDSEIAAIDKEAAERLALAKAPIEDVLGVMAIPLLADVLNSVVAGVNATLRRRGVQETVFRKYTSVIQRAALAMVDTMATADINLPNLIETDDTLVEAIEKKIYSYLRQRLNIPAK